jgi:hypothetical protein
MLFYPDREFGSSPLSLPVCKPTRVTFDAALQADGRAETKIGSRGRQRELVLDVVDSIRTMATLDIRVREDASDDIGDVAEGDIGPS